MRSIMLIALLSAIPAVAFAHSGSVFRVAVNYIPMMLALVPVFWTPLAKLFRRVLDRFRPARNHKRDPGGGGGQ